MIDGCDILDISQTTSLFCHQVSESGGAAVEAFNPPVLYQASLVTSSYENPEVTLFAGMALMCTTWPVAFAHVCIPIGVGIVYTWIENVIHLWGWG